MCLYVSTPLHIFQPKLGWREKASLRWFQTPENIHGVEPANTSPLLHSLGKELGLWQCDHWQDTGENSNCCHYFECDYRWGLDWWMDLLTTYTHDLELQAITVPLLKAKRGKVIPWAMETNRVVVSRLPHSLDNQPTDGDEAVSLTHWSPFTPRKIPGTNFCYCLCRPWSHILAGRVRSTKKSNVLIRNWTQGLPACAIVPQPTMPPSTTTISTINKLPQHLLSLFQPVVSSPPVPWQWLLTAEILQHNTLRFYLCSLPYRTA
jgi:hypothetical protein